MVQAGLVAADTSVDFVRTAFSRFAHKVGIGQKGPGHGDHIGHALCEYLLCHFGRVDSVGGHQRYADFAFELGRHPRKGGAGHLGGYGGNARLMPADTGVQNRHPSEFERLRQLHHFGQGRSAFHQVQHGQSEYHNEIGPYRLPNAAHDLQREADAVFVAATPGVFALVGLAGDKFIDEIAFRAHDLHAIVASALGQRGAARIVCNGLFDFFFA